MQPRNRLPSYLCEREIATETADKNEWEKERERIEEKLYDFVV